MNESLRAAISGADLGGSSKSRFELETAEVDEVSEATLLGLGLVGSNEIELGALIGMQMIILLKLVNCV